MKSSTIKIPLLKIVLFSTALTVIIQLTVILVMFSFLPYKVKNYVLDITGISSYLAHFKKNDNKTILKAANYTDVSNPYLKKEFERYQYKDVISIGSKKDFLAALKQADDNDGNTMILVSPGVYTLDEMININKDNIGIVALTSEPENTVIQGGRFKNSGINNLFRILGKNFLIEGITLQNARNHLIQIAGEFDADSPVLRNMIFQDSYQQLVKVSYDINRRPDVSSDFGLVENSIFRYSEGIAPNFYTAGIDIHAGNGWIIRNNEFSDIASPADREAEHAVHIWNNSHNNYVINNRFINNDRSIGFGMAINNHPNLKYSNLGGVIRNNTITHSKLNNKFSDVGIILEKSPKTLVENNRIWLEHNYPNAIEYRYGETYDVVISNNVTNKKIISRDGGEAKLENNNTNASMIDFADFK